MIDPELREMFAALRKEMGGLRDDLRNEMGELRNDLRKEMGELRDELRDEMRGGNEALRAEIAAAHIETMRHIDVVNEATKAKIELLAEIAGLVREDLRHTEARLD